MSWHESWWSSHESTDELQFRQQLHASWDDTKIENKNAWDTQLNKNTHDRQYQCINQRWSSHKDYNLRKLTRHKIWCHEVNEVWHYTKDTLITQKEF